MPFDPSRPFQRVGNPAAPSAPASTGFDPSRPFEVVADHMAASSTTGVQGPPPGKLESVLRGVAQGATLNFGDEIAAGVESFFTPKTYEQSVAESRAANEAAKEANPWSFGLGEVGGSLATAAIPGLGFGNVAKAAGVGGKLLAAAKVGGITGALSGAGASTAPLVDNPMGVAGDAATGGALGAGFGAGVQLVGMGISKGATALMKHLTDAVDPRAQLALAVGAGRKQLAGATTREQVGGAIKEKVSGTPLYVKTKRALQELWDAGIFKDAPDRPIDEHLLLDRVGALKADIGQKIGRMSSALGREAIDGDELVNLAVDIETPLLQLGAETPPGAARDTFSESIRVALDEILNTNGNLGALWELKSLAGKWAHNAWKTVDTPVTVKDGYKVLNRKLDDFLRLKMDALAKTSTDPALQQSYKQLSSLYEAAKTVEPLLMDKIGELAKQRSYLGFGGQDIASGGMVAALAAGVGVPPPVASALGYAGGMANQWARSAPGRIARANMGMALEQRAQKASEAMGAIPRTVSGFKQWAQRSFQTLPPQMQQPIAAILGAPEDRAEQMIRAAMPQFTQFFTKAKYPSEFEGKVTSDDDKAAIKRELQRLKMPSSEMAVRLSALNHDGTIAPEVFDPQAYQDQMQQMFAVAQKFGAGL